MRTLAVVAAVAALALLVVYAPSGDPDVWWHLRAGELALRHVPLSGDPFSYSYAGAPWRYRDALADVLLYRGYAAFSFRWFLALKLLAVGAEVLALIWFCPREGWSASLIVGGAGLLLATVPLVERPNLFTVACFPIFLVLLARARARPNRIVAAVLLAWAWMWLHRGGVLAVPLLAALSVFTLAARVAPTSLSAFFGPRPAWREAGSFAVATLATLALAFATPFGKEMLRSSFGVAGSAALRNSVSEWQRLSASALVARFWLPLVIAVVAIAFGVAKRSIDGWHAVLVLAFGVAIFDSVRWVPYFAAVSVLVLARALAPTLVRLSLRPLPVLVWSLAVAALFHARTAPFTLGEDRARLPVAAASFLDKAGLDGDVANAFDHGGYLIWRAWPRVRVLVDGRNETVYPPDFLARAVVAEHDPAVFDEMRAADHASVVVAENTPSRISHAFLATHAGWSMVFWSDAATVFVRNDAHPELTALRYTILDPRSLDGSVAKAMSHAGENPSIAPQIIAELGRMLAIDPDAIRPLVALVIFHQLRGDIEARDAALKHVLAVAPDHPAVIELQRRFRP